jgi:protoporphyrin/coproporphyrin ferrochelatase
MTSVHDALLLLSFGGPEGPDEVIPFLENVTRGRNIPRERLAQVGEHYYRFGGVSPINGHCRRLKAALEAELDIPVYWGNRNWKPFLGDTLRQMKADGVRRVAVFATSAYSGYSCCGQYRDDLDRAAAEVPGAPALHKLRTYYNHPAFAEVFVESARAALAKLPDALRGQAHLVFTAHSVPVAQPGRAAYEEELRDLAGVVAAETAPQLPWDLVFQSRSGPPSQPWLEPDVCDHLERLKSEGAKAVVLVPIGFVSDHMEVVYDLDVEAAELSAELGMEMVRAATPGAHPRFVAMVRELLEEAEPLTVGALGPRLCSQDACPLGCRSKDGTPRG